MTTEYVDQDQVALPDQEKLFHAPARFGNIPVERPPLGWDPKNPGFRNHYPVINLPTQIVDRVSFGAPDLEPNRLIWGDNLHVMRQLPSETVDLIYIDPPFFSNRVYNTIWGDQNEERSFSDIWEGGLDGYLVWLNARLYEMKRLLKPTGTIYVHCDYHASHYIKVEMDKVFGYENFRNEIVWCYRGGGVPKNDFARKHDNILRYTVGGNFKYHKQYVPYSEASQKLVRSKGGVSIDNKPRDLHRGSAMPGWWVDINSLQTWSPERVGYPTQKPEPLMQRILEVSSDPGDIVLDAFCGGGGFGVVAQRLGRQWIMIDQSRVAVAVSAERLKKDSTTRELGDDSPPDFTIEHWGIYEAEKLSEMPPEDFRQFVLHCYDARIPSGEDGIHGYKGSGARIPVWVGSPKPRERVGAADVNDFAEAIARLDRYQGDEGLRDGTMLAWGFRPDAQEAARLLSERDGLDLGLVRLNQIALESADFRSHVSSQSTERGDYSEFLTFVLPPLVEIAHKRIRGRTYDFSAGSSQVFNAGAKLINVQWDFNHRDGVFRAEPDTWFHKKKGKNAGPSLQAQHTFPHLGIFRVACRVQDDKGGEGMATIQIKVE